LGLHARRLALQSASRTDASFASRLLEQGNAAEGFAYFVRAVRKDPHNSAIVPRLLSALVTRNFILPEGAPLELPAATRNVRYSLDGTRVWVVGADSAIRLVSTSDRRVMNEFKFDQPIRAVVFPEKNDRVFAVRFADASRRMFDSATGQPLTPPMREERLLNFTLLSPDGRRLATASDTRIFIYDATTGRRRTVIDYARNRFVSNWSFSPDGQRLITSALGGFIRQWSTADGAPLGEEISIPGVLAGQAPFVDYRPDGKAFVVCAQSAGGQLFETATGRKVGPVMPHELCQSAQFTADGERLFTFGLDGGVTTVRTWDAATGKSLLPPWPVVGTFDFSFSHDGNVLFTSNRQGVAHVWDTRKGKPLAEPTPAVGRLARTSGSPDGTTVVMAADTKLYFFRIGAGAARPLDLRRTPPFMKAPFLAGTSARLLWFGKDRASVLDVASGREVSGGFSYPRSFTGLSTGGSDVRADAGAMAVLTGEPTTLKPDSHWEGWSLDAGGASHAVVLEDAPVGSPPGSNWLCFSPRGDLVALTANTSAQTIRVWSLITGKPLAPPIAMDSRLALTNSRPAAFSPDGTRLAVGAVSGAARVWDVATGRGVFDLEPAAPSYIRFVSFSPDGERIATGSASGLVRLWDAKTGQLIREPIVLDASLGALEFSKDGRLLLTSTPDNTRLWDGRTAEPIGEPFAAGEVTRGAQFNDDGSRLATAHNTNGATIWDTATQQPITEPLAHPGVRVVSAELSPDGRFLRTETSDNHFYVWPVPPAAGNVPVPGWLADLATICIGQRLTDAGQLESATDALARIDDVRRTLASLPDDAPYVEWGRWFLANRATRSIAPGFTITPAEAETLAKSISGQ
jgi:WD40 repeat protein